MSRATCLLKALACCLAVSSTASVCLGQVAKEATQLKERLATITRGSSSADRASSIASLLDLMKVEYKSESFEEDGKSGKNLIVDLGDESKPQLLIGAHFDQVKVGNGVVDNAGGCSLMLELIERFNAKPLENHCLRFVFFDLEEVGLLGSTAYVKSLTDESKPVGFINIDIFGYGDTLWMMSPSPESQLPASFSKACKASKLGIEVSPMKQYPPADHVPFVKADIATIAIALIDNAEIQLVKNVISGKRGEFPPILQTIHTPDDTMEKIDSTQCAKATPSVVEAIRIFDRTTANSDAAE